MSNIKQPTDDHEDDGRKSHQQTNERGEIDIAAVYPIILLFHFSFPICFFCFFFFDYFFDLSIISMNEHERMTAADERA